MTNPQFIKDGSRVKQKVAAPIEGLVTEKHFAGDKINYKIKTDDGQEFVFDSNDLEVTAEPEAPTEEEQQPEAAPEEQASTSEEAPSN